MFPLLWPDHQTSENPQGGFSVEAGLVALEQTAPTAIKRDHFIRQLVRQFEGGWRPHGDLSGVFPHSRQRSRSRWKRGSEPLDVSAGHQQAGASERAARA